MDVLIWVNIAGLAAAWTWASTTAVRERDLRLLLPAALLPLLAARHLIDPIAGESTWLELLAAHKLNAVLLAAAIDLAAIATTAVFCRSIRERNRAERFHWQAMEALRNLADFFVGAEGGYERKLQQLLQLGCKELTCQFGVLTRCGFGSLELLAVSAVPSRATLESKNGSPGEREDEADPTASTLEREFVTGDVFALDTTYCASTLETRGPLCIDAAGVGLWADHPARDLHKLESYIGVAIRLDGELYGTLYFAGHESRKQRFLPSQKTLIELMGHWIEAALQRQRSEGERAELVRLQRAAADLSALSPKRGHAAEFLGQGLEKVVKTLDLDRASLLDYQAEQEGFRTIAAVGSAEDGDEDVATVQADLSSVFAPMNEAGRSAAVCVPVAFEGETIGSLTARPNRPRLFSAEELDFLHIAAARLSDSMGELCGLQPATPQPGRQLVPRRSERYTDTRVELRRVLQLLVDEVWVGPSASARCELVRCDTGLQVAVERAALDKILRSLMQRVGELAACRTLRLEARAVAGHPADSEDGKAARQGRLIAPPPTTRYAQLSIFAPDVSLDSDALAGLFSPEGVSRSEGHPLSLHRIERLIRDAKGDLSVASEQDKGSCFTVYLPLARAESDRGTGA